MSEFPQKEQNFKFGFEFPTLYIVQDLLQVKPKKSNSPHKTTVFCFQTAYKLIIYPYQQFTQQFTKFQATNRQGEDWEREQETLQLIETTEEKKSANVKQFSSKNTNLWNDSLVFCDQKNFSKGEMRSENEWVQNEAKKSVTEIGVERGQRGKSTRWVSSEFASWIYIGIFSRCGGKADKRNPIRG